MPSKNLQLKKILFLMPSMVGGGAERTLINLLSKMDYNRYHVDLLVVSNNGVYLNQVPRQVEILGLFKNDFLVRVLAFLQKKYGLQLLYKYVIKKKVKKKYDVGISFLDGNFTDLLFLIQGLNKRITWVHSSYKTYRNFAKFYENEKYRNKLMVKRYGKLDAIYFVSNDAMAEFIQIFGTYPKMEVIYNLINEKQIQSKAAQFSAQANSFKGFTFLALGSLLPVKGFDRLIRASAIVKNKGFDFSVKIVGEGPERQNLQKLIAEFNLEGNVELLGFNNNPYPLLKRATVFVMTSVSEALPTALCEAMILKKPVIVTNCSGCRELVDKGNYGLMAEQSDTDLAQKMTQLLSDPSLISFYEEKSLKRSELFNDDFVLNKYYQVFDQ